MRLATIRDGHGTRAVRVDGDQLVDLGVADVGALLRLDGWPDIATRAGTTRPAAGAEFAAPVVHPGKIVCVGLNFAPHILEMGHALPDHPTLFAKYAEALIGPDDDIVLPPESSAMDWEVELALVIGRPVRRAGEAEAAAAIAGFTVLNDITARDWQYRTEQWLQGKTFEATTPLGPVLVTPEELPGGVAPEVEVSSSVNGETMQRASTKDLVFPPVDLVRYVSTIVTLQPGDVIATGTPAGVGHGRRPPRYLAGGDVVVAEVEGIGRLTNRCRA